MLAAVVLAPAFAPAHEYQKESITVVHPWSPPTIGRVPVAAVYMTITSSTEAGDRLIDIESPLGHAQLHQSVMENGIMKMRPVGPLAIKHAEPLELAPGGYHIMLRGLKAPLKKGDMIPMTLRFEKTGDVKIEALVTKPDEPGAAPKMNHDDMKGM